MFGLLGSQRLSATSSAALATEEVLRAGVRKEPDVNVIATRREHEVEALIWSYHDDDVSAPGAEIDLNLDGLPPEVTRGVVEHFRIDSTHSNAFAAWKQMGSPQSLSAAQYEQLQKEGQLQLLTAPESVPIQKGSLHLHFSLPRQSMSLVRLAW